MIGSGWWCSNGAPLTYHKGDAIIRESQFHQAWYRLVNYFTKPSRILIVDSASPIPPPKIDDDRIHIHKLAMNPGHATQCQTRFCGWTASVLLGLQDCIHSDNDYFVYIEQDVLIYGEGIIEYAISKMTTPFMFGDATGIPHPLQQSLFIIHREGIEHFLSRLLARNETDKELPPERKFHLATQHSVFSWKPVRWLAKRRRCYDFLPFGYGRKRPLDMNEPHFYFQHGTRNECLDFEARTKEDDGISLFDQE